MSAPVGKLETCASCGVGIDAGEAIVPVADDGALMVAHAACAGRDWVTGPVVARAGMYRFTHLIRSPDDPDRGGAGKGQGRGWGGAWRQVAKRSAEDCAADIRELLADGNPRTFNAICVELYDKTADVLMDKPPDAALWRLVEERAVEHSLIAPILFRLRGQR